jgi:hypothetical protein
MGTGITDVIGEPHDFLPSRSDEFQKLCIACFFFISVQSNPFICKQQMSEHIIHLYGVFNNKINEIPTRGDTGTSSVNSEFVTALNM